MHIAMVSDLEARGGAAIAASRLAAALRQAGHSVTRIVAFPAPGGTDCEMLGLARPRRPRALRRWTPGAWAEAYAGWVQQRSLASALRETHPDVINVHNLHAASRLGWTPEIVKICADHAPVVWTLHDTWSFTGRCAYNGSCQKYLTGCDASCPTFFEYPALAPERIARAWCKRRALLRSARSLVAVTPSQWLAKVAAQGLWAGRDIHVIPNGLPLALYRPWNRAQVRAALGLPSPPPYLMIVAERLTERRKGGHLLADALRYVDLRPLTLLTLGKEQLPIDLPGVRVNPLGYVDDEQRMALAYCAADLLVHPATEDNLPNVVMEAIACGTPVVALPIGGVPEMVRPGLTGALAADLSAASLGRAIQAMLEATDGTRQLRATCRQIAKAEYSASLQAERYLTLFSTLVHD